MGIVFLVRWNTLAVEAEKVKKSDASVEKYTDTQIREIRGVSMVTKESVGGHRPCSVRVGMGSGAVDRTSYLRNSMEGSNGFKRDHVCRRVRALRDIWA